MANCLICGDTPPDSEIWDHLRLMHPDHWGDGERWPDGEPVIHDLTLQPDDFTGGGDA